MKYTIHGFYQPKAVELGLTADALLVLRWFVDFAGTNRMMKVQCDDGIYFWVNYKTILEDLPILSFKTKDWLKRKIFDVLVKADVLKHKTIKSNGTFSYYTFGENYEQLIKIQEGTENNPYGGTNNNPQGYGDKSATNNSSISNQSITLNESNKSLEYSTRNQVSGCEFNFKILEKQIKKQYKQVQGISMSIEEVIAIFEYFTEQHNKYCISEHPNLSNDTVLNIIQNIEHCEATGGIQGFDLDYDCYIALIDFYFTQDFDGNEQGCCNYSIAHFMNDDIRSNCYYKTCY